MWKFYVAKVLELIGIVSLGAGLLIGIGNHTDFFFPVGRMSPEKAMGIELVFFLGGMAIFGIGRWVERRVAS